MDLNWLSAAELLKGYRKKKFSPVEVVKACLGQIDRHDKSINAMRLVDEKQALKRARAGADRGAALPGGEACATPALRASREGIRPPPADAGSCPPPPSE